MKIIEATCRLHNFALRRIPIIESCLIHSVQLNEDEGLLDESWREVESDDDTDFQEVEQVIIGSTLKKVILDNIIENKLFHEKKYHRE